MSSWLIDNRESREPVWRGEWEGESLDDGRLLLSPHAGPSVPELAVEYGEPLPGEAFERRWHHLARDRDGSRAEIARGRC